MEICDLLKQTRIDLGLTQQGMVGEVMSVAQYSRIESREQRIKAEDLLELLESHNAPILPFLLLSPQLTVYQPPFSTAVERPFLDLVD